MNVAASVTTTAARRRLGEKARIARVIPRAAIGRIRVRRRDMSSPRVGKAARLYGRRARFRRNKGAVNPSRRLWTRIPRLELAQPRLKLLDLGLLPLDRFVLFLDLVQQQRVD